MKMIGETSWVKNKPKNHEYGEQVDWNQTLMTKINQCGAQLFQDRIKHKKSEQVERKIVVPNDFKEQFETLAYYDKDTQKLMGRFPVEFEDCDVILVLENENYCTIQLIS